MQIVNQIVRRLHVSATDMEVIRAVIDRLKDKKRTFLAQPKDVRRDIMKAAISAAADNRRLFKVAMAGGKPDNMKEG
jgi:hypothetical protein